MEAHYNTRIKDCQTEAELCEYLLTAVPHIREYVNESVEKCVTTHSVLGVELKVRQGVQRKEIYKNYLLDVENEGFESRRSEYFYQPCKGCGEMHTKIHDDVQGDEICKECGHSEFVLGDGVGFKEEQEMEKNVVYSYKRENHFNEWVSQFQAKESTSVPAEVLDQLRSEFKKQKIKDLSEITHEKVKALLKKLNKSKYYEHVPYITTILNGIQPPTMPQALEDKLRLMFYQIQKPFEKHKPPNRKNFLSYSYVLYKFCELLSEDDYLPCFPLLKSTEKLHVQDTIWKKICEELKWEYIRTV